MKKLFFCILCIVVSTNAQEFTVEKVSGVVMYLSGTSEKWVNVKSGQILSSNTLILAESNSLVRLKKADEIFILRGDAAIGLNHLKKVSVNDLILALTLDEIRNVPKIKSNGLSKNTAVYGSNEQKNKSAYSDDKYLGEKKIKGARQLSENGYQESSIIAAKEVFRNYPSINTKFDERLYFADLLSELKLYEEALEDYIQISNLELNSEENNILEARIASTNMKMVENN